MASFSVPCPKCACSSFASFRQQQKQSKISFSPSGLPHLARIKGPDPTQLSALKAQVSEVAVEKSSNASAISITKLEVPLTNGKDIEPAKKTDPHTAPLGTSMSSFMAEVSSLVKLVDSKDITELQVKQLDYEIIIRKKEALQQPPSPAPVIMMNSPSPQAMFPSQLPFSHLPAAPSGPAPSPASVPSLPAPAKSGKSGHPPLKSPMAGTFYRTPGPGESPFVKVGDKVQQGQVVCIIEAMKLMNEIEAEQSGTIVEILVENEKPVSIDTPLFIIEP